MQASTSTCVILLLACVSCATATPKTGQAVKNDNAIHTEWRVINDTVMGGVSSSSWRVSELPHGTFSGIVSLENYGGFASVRGAVPQGYFGNTSAIQIRIKGDGQVYKFCVYTHRAGPSIGYQSAVKTTGDWQTVSLPLSGFQAKWRGRLVGDAPPAQAADIAAVGFMISDKQAGPFTLTVSEIKPRSETTSK